ncbi:MAG: hypothetical protein AAB794_00495 [Patescibacteria group bacterium]
MTATEEEALLQHRTELGIAISRFSGTHEKIGGDYVFSPEEFAIRRERDRIQSALDDLEYLKTRTPGMPPTRADYLTEKFLCAAVEFGLREGILSGGPASILKRSIKKAARFGF